MSDLRKEIEDAVRAVARHAVAPDTPGAERIDAVKVLNGYLAIVLKGIKPEEDDPKAAGRFAAALGMDGDDGGDGVPARNGRRRGARPQ